MDDTVEEVRAVSRDRPVGFRRMDAREIRRCQEVAREIQRIRESGESPHLKSKSVIRRERIVQGRNRRKQ